MRKVFITLGLVGLVALTSPVLAACPNAASSVTIPLSGSATITMYDQLCDVLPGTGFTVQFSNSGGFPVNATSVPAVTADATGLHFTANGAAPGTTGTFYLKYSGNGDNTSISYLVGAPVTSVSVGTTTP
jgi:predicted small secreted protein